MKSIFTFVFFLLLLTCLNTKMLGQDVAEIDSINKEICLLIENRSDLEFDSLLTKMYELHVFEYLMKFEEEDQVDVFLRMDLRLQRNCKAYSELLRKNTEQGGDWAAIDSFPESQLSKNILDSFFLKTDFMYLESNGDTVHVRIDNKFWIDSFADSSYSKLHFKRTSDCDFTITFIESNNILRKNMSIPGDKYDYRILGSINGTYKMAVRIPNQDTFLTFNLYTK